MPVLFYIFGKKIRGRSKFAPAPDIQQDKRRDEESRLQNGETRSQATGTGSDTDKEKERDTAL
jgi:MFS transporter, DHA1 family, multidrug resistance protein